MWRRGGSGATGRQTRRRLYEPAARDPCPRHRYRDDRLRCRSAEPTDATRGASDTRRLGAVARTELAGRCPRRQGALGPPGVRAARQRRTDVGSRRTLGPAARRAAARQPGTGAIPLGKDLLDRRRHGAQTPAPSCSTATPGSRLTRAWPPPTVRSLGPPSNAAAPCAWAEVAPLSRTPYPAIGTRSPRCPRPDRRTQRNSDNRCWSWWPPGARRRSGCAQVRLLGTDHRQLDRCCRHQAGWGHAGRAGAEQRRARGARKAAP